MKMVHVAQDYFTFAFPAKENGCKVFFHVIQVFDDKTREYYTYICFNLFFLVKYLTTLFLILHRKRKKSSNNNDTKKNGISIS